MIPFSAMWLSFITFKTRQNGYYAVITVRADYSGNEEKQGTPNGCTRDTC